MTSSRQQQPPAAPGLHAGDEPVDVTDRLRRALRDSETLRFIGQQLAGQVDVDALLSDLVRHARAILDADLAVVAARDQTGGTRWIAAVGFKSARYQEFGSEPAPSSITQVSATRGPIIFEVATHPDEHTVLAEERVSVAFGVPLLARGLSLGALIVGYRREVDVTPHEIALAQALAAHASISVENARLIAQAELRAAEADAERRLLRAVLDSLPVGLVIADAVTGEITHVNEMGSDLLGTSLAGVTMTEAVAVLDMRGPDGTPLSREEWPAVRAVEHGETLTGVETTVRTPDGARPLLFNAAPVYGPAGGPVAVVTAFQDVSHLKEVERLKDEFLSVASHELKTPLTPLLGLTQLMLRSLERGNGPSPEQLATNLRSIHRQAMHMSELVSDLLDVSRLQQGRLELHPQEFDLIALVADVLERFESLQTDRDRRLFRLQTEVQSVTGSWDRSRIDQILTNLISNAIKYSPLDSDVSVRVAVLDDSVRLSVRDQGIGIPVSEQARLFEPFYRASNASVRNYPGVGLGLHITRELIERHGGHISVESDVGQGTTFIVELPLMTAPPSPDPSPAARERGT